jgi:hypothetical protein
MPHLDARHVSDCVQLARWKNPDNEADIPGPWPFLRSGDPERKQEQNDKSCYSYHRRTPDSHRKRLRLILTQSP